MIYSNVEYLLLFFTTLALYLMFPGSYRTRFVILTLASLFFYAWLSIVECLVFLFVVVFSWLFLWIATRDPKRKVLWLAIGITVMTLHLFFWKYAGWITEILFHIAPVSMQGRVLLFPLPAGISFFTLQGIAYLVDYGRGEAQMMRFDKYLLFKSFFPQLVAGPIVRAHDMKPQLDRLQPPVERDLWLGACLFCVGFAKKVIIADRIAPLIDPIFANPRAFNRWSLWLAPIGFTVQLWADFSGYTDMGRASARMLGLHLPENFRSPFFSQSGSEFWTRWHITLSTWIKDYVFKPLLRLQSGVNTIGSLALVSFVTMVLSGLWHGAAFSFLLWGVFNGLWLACERFLRKHPLFSMPPLIKWALFFLLFNLSMVVFRAASIDTMIMHLASMFGARTGTGTIDGSQVILISLLAMMGYHWATYSRTPSSASVPRDFSPLERFEASLQLDSWATQTAIAFAVALVFCITLFFRPGAEAGSFIYFKF